jgi:hypothetical protein
MIHHKVEEVNSLMFCKSLFSTIISVFSLLGLIGGGLRGLVIPLFACIGSAGASVFIGDFWDDKTQIPLVQSYSEAVDSTKKLRGYLALLGILWGLSFILDCLY